MTEWTKEAMERGRGKRYRLVASFPFVSSLFLATNSPFILFPLSSIPFSSSRVFPCRRFLRQIMDTGERNGISFPHLTSARFTRSMQETEGRGAVSLFIRFSHSIPFLFLSYVIPLYYLPLSPVKRWGGEG